MQKLPDIDDVKITVVTGEDLLRSRAARPAESYEEESARMDAAFELVKNRDHWKDQCRGYVPAEKVDDVLAAVIYFTGTVGSTYGPMKSGPHKGLIRITAPGYWRGPCADQ